ncbi:CWF19-like protein 1 isoform X1 [Styela clava]
MASDALKVMVCGDAEGKIEVVFNRIEKLMKKGSRFDILFAVGDFFAEEMPDSWLSYRNGTKKPPIPTYILGPNSSEHLKHYGGGDEDGFDIGENITYLGRKGVFTTSGGLKVVYLSGLESPSGSTPAPKHCFSEADIKSLVTSVTNAGSKNFVGVDLLLTSQWPKAVCTYGNAPSDDKCLKCGSILISQLASAIRPRYHFSALEKIHYERLPYRNHVVLSDSTRHTTRFISLAPVGNADKQKYLYAFTITPMTKIDQSELLKMPADATECPYFKRSKQDDGKSIAQMSTESFLQDTDESAQFRWNINKSNSPGLHRKRKSDFNKNAKRGKTERPQDWKCWFCLAGEKVEKHLVASVGNQTYLAMAKGGIVEDHIMILPIAHHQSSLDLPDDTELECTAYKLSLKKALKDVGKKCVFFERNYRTDHMQIQVVPVPDSISSTQIKNAFIKLGQQHTDRQGKPQPLEIAEIPKNTELKQILSASQPFFHVELPDGTRLLHTIKAFFPLQFGREAICGALVLNVPDRVNWRDCVLVKDDEVTFTKKFRDVFTPHDFAREEEDDDEEET